VFSLGSTRRDSNGRVCFLEVNDGSCLPQRAVIADANLPNYESEIKRLGPGGQVVRRGRDQASGREGQATELAPARGRVTRADPEADPWKRSGIRFEKLPRMAIFGRATTPFGALARGAELPVRSIHNFFQKQGSCTSTRRHHPPAIAEGAGEMFQ